MLRILLLSFSHKFTQLTPEIYPMLFKQFSKKPSVHIFKEYFIPQNLIEIFNIVREAQIDIEKKIKAFDEIESFLCTNNTDLQFNIIANIHREKSTIYSYTNKLPMAIEEIEKAILAIEAMDQPFCIEVVMLYETAANLYMQIQQLNKAEKYLDQAKHSLQLFTQEIKDEQLPEEAEQNQIKSANFMLAKIYSARCLAKLQGNKIIEARDNLFKSLQKWDQLEEKNNVPYSFTIKYKCLFHTACREEDNAMQTAISYLKQFPQTNETIIHRMWFMKFLADRGKSEYVQILKGEIERLSKVMSEGQLAQILVRIGVLNKKQKKPEEKNKLSS